jgi:hypothetical protein
MLMIAFVPSTGVAAEVGFQLDTKSLTTSDEPKSAATGTIEFKDRVWDAPGVEETSEDAASFEVCRVSGPIRNTESKVSGLNDAIWPRTREMFDRPANCRPEPFFCPSLAIHGVLL